LLVVGMVVGAEHFFSLHGIICKFSPR